MLKPYWQAHSAIPTDTPAVRSNDQCIYLFMLLFPQFRDQHIESLKAVFEADDMHERKRNNDDQVFFVLAFELSHDVCTRSDLLRTDHLQPA